MYGNGGVSTITGTVVAGSGAAVLPYTGENRLGTVLAYTAITIGLTALISQVVIRLVRHLAK